MVKHFDYFVLLSYSEKVACYSLQFVCVYLFVDEVFNFFFTLHALLYLLTGVENCCNSGHNVGIKSDPNQNNEYVCFGLLSVLGRDVAITHGGNRNHSPVAACYVLHQLACIYQIIFSQPGVLNFILVQFTNNYPGGADQVDHEYDSTY